MTQVIEACASYSRWPGGAGGAERPTWWPLASRGWEHVGRGCCCEADVHVLFHFHSLTFLLPHEVSGRPSPGQRWPGGLLVAAFAPGVLAGQPHGPPDPWLTCGLPAAHRVIWKLEGGRPRAARGFP